MKQGKVSVVNKTGSPTDTEVRINGKLVPLTHLMSVKIVIHPDNGTTAILELRAEEIYIEGAKLKKEGAI